jgi:AraC family transcriptional regulator, transcriptional activator of pobA
LNIPRGTVHGFDFAPGTEGFVLSLPAASFPDIFATQRDALAPLGQTFTAPAPASLVSAFAGIAADHAGDSPLRQLRLRAAAMTLCCIVAEIAPKPTAGPLAGAPRIAAFEALVRANLDRGWTLADFSKALLLSERHLRRICRQATGLSAHALIETIRLREACRLLAYTRMQVQEVAFALGYDDPAYFARAFRRSNGLSPSDYRARLETL